MTNDCPTCQRVAIKCASVMTQDQHNELKTLRRAAFDHQFTKPGTQSWRNPLVSMKVNSVNEFCDWLAGDSPQCIYHVGNLAFNCMYGPGNREELSLLRERVFEVAVRGEVYLMQRRVSLEKNKEAVEYLAIRSKTRVPDYMRPIEKTEDWPGVIIHSRNIPPSRPARRTNDAGTA